MVCFRQGTVADQIVHGLRSRKPITKVRTSGKRFGTRQNHETIRISVVRQVASHGSTSTGGGPEPVAQFRNRWSGKTTMCTTTNRAQTHGYRRCPAHPCRRAKHRYPSPNIPPCRRGRRPQPPLLAIGRSRPSLGSASLAPPGHRSGRRVGTGRVHHNTSTAVQSPPIARHPLPADPSMASNRRAFLPAHRQPPQSGRRVRAVRGGGSTTTRAPPSDRPHPTAPPAC